MGWVSVDDHDNDPAVLLTYIAVALDRIERDRPDGVPGARVVGGGHRGAAPAGVGDGGDGRPVALVLDHVEAVTNRECLDTIAALALGLPARSQLAIGSRDVLPLPEARLRAQGGIVEIGVDDLAMDERRGRPRCSREAGVELADDDVRELVRRTEGWPAGLYLAALATAGGRLARGDRRDVHR